MIKGKNIVITGANSGIGLETLKLLANGDNTILAVDLRTDRIEALGLKNVIPMVCDVSTKENVDSIFKTADEKLGSIDIFFANAGFPYYETMDYVNWERIEDIFKVNVFCPSIHTKNTSNISAASKVRWQSRCRQSASSQCPATRCTAQASLQCKASNKVCATSFPKTLPSLASIR